MTAALAEGLVREMAAPGPSQELLRNPVMRLAARRMVDLESALERAYWLLEHIKTESKGQWPPPDLDCVACTDGAIPLEYTNGLCPLHEAKQLLGQLLLQTSTTL